MEIGIPRTIGADGEKPKAVSDTTLIADADTFSSGPAASKPDLAALPATLAARVTAYETEKTALQGALAARIKALGTEGNMREAIDAFNSENSGRIAALNRDAEGIRSALASLAEASPHPAAGQSVDALVRQFNDRVQEIETGSPLFTHP